jgi:hypothetical protein
MPDPADAIADAIAEAISELGGDPSTAIVTDYHVEDPPGGPVVVEAPVEYTETRTLPERIFSIGSELPIEHIPGRATGTLQVQGTRVDVQALERLLGAGEPGILRGMTQIVSTIDDAAHFGEVIREGLGVNEPPPNRPGEPPEGANANGDLLPITSFTRQPLALRDPVAVQIQQQIMAAEDAEIFRRLDAVAQNGFDRPDFGIGARVQQMVRDIEDARVNQLLSNIDGPTPSWVVNPADPNARVSPPIPPPIRAERVTMPLFEIASNPSIPLTAIQARRFNLIDREPPKFEVGEWVTYTHGEGFIYKVLEVAEKTVTVQCWNEEVWDLVGLLVVVPREDCHHSPAPVKNVWQRLMEEEDLF